MSCPSTSHPLLLEPSHDKGHYTARDPERLLELPDTGDAKELPLAVYPREVNDNLEPRYPLNGRIGRSPGKLNKVWLCYSLQVGQRVVARFPH